MNTALLRRSAAVPLLLALAASPVGAQIQVTGYGASRTILPHLLGYNNQMSATANPWSSASRRGALVAARPGVMRYPGGTVSSYWDTFHGRRFSAAAAIDATDITAPRDFTQARYTIDWVAASPAQPNPITDFKLAYDAVAGAPGGAMAVVFVLNLTTPGADYYAAAWGRSVDQTPQSADWWAMMDDRYARAVVMLDDAVAAGLPVRYVEFGNEYYFGAGGSGPTGATVEPYSAGVVPSDPAMRGAFPGSGADYAAAVNDWAPGLLGRYPGVRLCAIGSDGGGSGRRANWNNDVVRLVDATLVPAVSYHLYGGVTAGDVTSTESNLGAALASWSASWRSTRTSAPVRADREAWFTEFNANVGPQSWGQGLQALSSIHAWLSDGNLGLALMHQFATPVMAGAGPGITATGRALSLFNLAAKGRTRARALILSLVPTLAGSGDPGMAGVYGYAFDTGSGTDASVVLVNLRGAASAIGLAGISAAAGSTYTRASAALAATADPGETVGTLAAVEALPAYSITVFSVAAGTAPTITVQPAGLTTTVGASVSLTVVASGEPSPTYQWRRNGSAIAGATAASFSLPSAQISDSGTYSVVVSNQAGSVTSDTVTVTVNGVATPPPSAGGGGGGGGGAPGSWFTVLVAALLLARAWRRGR